MPQNFTKGTNFSAIQRALGFQPKPRVVSGSGVTVDQNSGVVAVDTLPTTTTFGAGAPVAAGTLEGDLYFDTTLAVYAGYVWHSAAWHQF